MKVDFEESIANLFGNDLFKIKFQNHAMIQLLKGIFIIFFFCSLIGDFFGSIVGFYGSTLDDDGRVAPLDGLTPSRDRPCHVACTQPERRSECRQGRYQHRDDDFNDLFLFHNFLALFGSFWTDR